jgi:ribosomal protein L12E/L44/L45/RPP1/RPP2
MSEVVPMPKKSVAVAGKAELGVNLGPPVLLEGEDLAQYERLLAQVTAAVEPVDVIEELWVRDVVDLAWEGLRLRRLKTDLLVASTRAGLHAVLDGLVGFKEVGPLVNGWYRRDPEIIRTVEDVLETAGLSMDHASAKTLSTQLDDVERIDRMIANAEARRHVVLREVDRHRAAVAARLRAAAEVIEEGEFEEVPAQAARQVRAA